MSSTRPARDFGVVIDRSASRAEFRWPSGPDGAGCLQTLTSPNQRMRLALVERLQTSGLLPGPELPASGELALGDASELGDAHLGTAMGNAVAVRYDTWAPGVSVSTSITGLPPVFFWEGPGRAVVTSDLGWLTDLVTGGLRLDPRAVGDLFLRGFPTGYRTLFEGVSLVPGGTVLSIGPDLHVTRKQMWHPPSPDPCASWDQYVELQAAAFRAAVAGLDLRQSFVSLTGGLDTRAILAILLQRGRPVPACTLSGPGMTLDARTAVALCQAYDVPHEIVHLDQAFLDRLPELTLRACRLTGGLASVEQAHEVYFYERLGSRFGARLSGNLGNQLGRGSVERISLRSVDPTILSLDLRRASDECRSEAPWGPDGDTEDLIQGEYAFATLANHGIGHHYAVQQSPYANRLLIELRHREPAGASVWRREPRWRMRVSDLRYRFLGVPEMRSFQRRLIREPGGFVASCPINWGWRAGGGVSVSGELLGCVAALDALSAKMSWNGRVSRLLERVRVTGMHEYLTVATWMRTRLRELVCDTLLSGDIATAGVLDRRAVTRMLEEHYSGRARHDRALVGALDLALATRTFRAAR